MNQGPEPSINMGRIDVIMAPNGDRLLPVEQAARLLRVAADAMPGNVTSEVPPGLPPEAAEVLARTAEAVAAYTVEVCQGIPRRLADELAFAAMVSPLDSGVDPGPEPEPAPEPAGGRIRQWGARLWKAREIIGLGAVLLLLGAGAAASAERGDWTSALYQMALSVMAVAWSSSLYSARIARAAARAATDALYYERRPDATR